ncbi:MAG: DUF262 domain-containing protein [Bacteroidales bacterium]|nr:DUF262 domain-containing protein [Bacteroidales bacterium]
MDAINRLLSIEEIVKDNFFKIPDYQRGYSWEKKQLVDLTKDIEHVSKIDHKHYTGTIVVSKNETLGKYEVVDGQQRLTTIIILLKLIYETDRVKYAEIKKKFIVRGDGKYVLETNKETNVYFKETILNDKKILPEDIKSLSNLKFAKTYFSKWLEDNKPHIDIIYKTIIHKLGFICFAPHNNSEIGIMFEVINNRGKELSELEKIKNYFIYYASINSVNSLRDKVNDCWGNILRYLSKAQVISNEEENQFLRNCYLVFFSANKGRSWYVYDELKIKYDVEDNLDIEKKAEEIKSFIDFIEQAAQSYAFFYNGDFFNTEYKEKNKLVSVLKRLRCHPVNASIMPLYIAAMSYLHERTDDVIELLDIIEKLNFRVYVLLNPHIRRSDSNQGVLFQWAFELYRDREWTSHDAPDDVSQTWLKRIIEGDIFDYTKMQLIDFTKVLCSEESFVQSLTVDNDETNVDFYHWNGLRFFFASYEECLNSKERSESWDIENILITREEAKGEKANDYLSREHIWATENMSDIFDGYHKEKRRLGNFVLLGMRSNIQLQDGGIEEKVDFMLKNNLISMLQVKKLVKYLEKATQVAKSQRNRKTKYYYLDQVVSFIDQRENDLIKFALERWKMPDEKLNHFVKVDTFKANDERQIYNYFMK